MPSGSIYTFIGTVDPSNRTSVIQTSQGSVAIGQYGYFLPSEVADAEGLGLILQPGIVVGSGQSSIRQGPAITAIALASLNASVFPISAFRAKSDGSTDDTTAIQEADAAAAQAGGGVVSYPITQAERRLGRGLGSDD